jgi:two-component system, NarL family, sensor histidine kinase DevS
VDRDEPTSAHAVGEPGQAVDPRLLTAGGFPHAARLELDELLEQLIDRARDVQATQGRLRGLLRANLTVASAVDLEEVLSHILESARALVNAEYAALGVVDHGRLVRFIHTGMSTDTVAAIGHLPEGKGLLGRLIDFPQPLRLPDIAGHMSSVGFPEHHPSMRSFLGVPIRVGKSVFGNLYLTNKLGGGDFSPDDEELVLALAAAAGAAINNAALFARARQRERWEAAMYALSTAVLTAEQPEHAYALIATHAQTAIGAAGVSVCVPGPQPGTVKVAAAQGVFEEFRGQVLKSDDTVYGLAFEATSAVVIDDPMTDPRMAGREVEGVGPMIAMPMRTQVATDGVLFLARASPEPVFDPSDVELVGAYSDRAALLLQLADARRSNEEFRIADDRRQIAQDLQSGVFARLSRLGVDLQALAARSADPGSRVDLQKRVEAVDEIIHELRSAIFALHADESCQ